MKLLINLICIFVLASTSLAAEEWLNFSNPLPVKSAFPYGDGLLMGTGGGVRYRTNTADDMYTTSNGLGDESVSAVLVSDRGMFAVSDNGIIATLAANNYWQVLSRSYAGSSVSVIPDMARLAGPVIVIAFEDRLSFFSLNSLSSILTIERIADASLAINPVSAMEVHGDSLFVAVGKSLYVRKMNWDKLESDLQLSNPDSWTLVKDVSGGAEIKSIAWKDGKLKTFATEGMRLWDKDGETVVALDTFSVFSSSSSMVRIRGKVLMDSVLYVKDSIVAVIDKLPIVEARFYKSIVRWVALLPSGKAILAGPQNVFYYDGKKVSDLTEYKRFAIGGAYELQALPGGGVLAASEDGKFSYNYGYEWSEPATAYETYGSWTNARAHDMKALSVVPSGAVFYHIWGIGYFLYGEWGNNLVQAALAKGDYCFDNYLEDNPQYEPYTIAVATTPAPDGMGFFSTSASNKGYSLIYMDLDGNVSCANNIGSTSIAGPLTVRADNSTGEWVAYVGTRSGASLSANGGLDVIRFPHPKSTGGELSSKLTKADVKTYYGTTTTPLDIVYEPKTGYFWFVTESSLAYWNEDQDSLRTPLSTNGLMGAGFTSIDVDSRGNLWVGTSTQGVYRMTPRVTNPDTLSVLHFTTRQGLLSDRVQDVAVDSTLGWVWFAHENGVSRYRRNDLRGTDGNMTGEAREDVKVYPNPFRPLYQPYVVFDNISDDAVVSVYNRGGKLVVSLSGDKIAGGRVEWDGKMKNGNFVAPGVYQYVIRGGSKTKKGKLLIIH